MGNQTSSSSSSSPSKRRSSRRTESQSAADIAAERAKRVVGELHEGIKNSVKKLDDDHPAAQLIDHICGVHYAEEKYRDKYRDSRSASYYSEDVSDDGSRAFQSEDDTTYDGRRHVGRRRSDKSIESSSCMTQSEFDSERRRNVSFDTEEEESRITQDEPKLISKPLASSFAKRCYFTKAGIGKTKQHYEGLTLTGNVVLMLASAMKLKGCPTICDEDLRRVEQTYPNQFSRLPDELLLSSGWRRISKYCHFSNKPIPDGIPFFHSKQRLHQAGGYYFLLAAAVGMVRPIDVEPLTKDTLVLLETDFPNQCDATPSVLIRDPDQWVLVNKFCFFSGGPINTEEDVYYQADFDGNPIYMLAFLSPSLTPEELYKLNEVGPDNEPGLTTVAEVQNVESVYDLTDRDFDDLKLYHLGPCRALPQYILQPSAWTKVLPPHFLAARQQAMLRSQEYEARFEQTNTSFTCFPEHQLQGDSPDAMEHSDQIQIEDPQEESVDESFGPQFLREVEEEGAFHCTASLDNSSKDGLSSPIAETISHGRENSTSSSSRFDPPDNEPPSLEKKSLDENDQDAGMTSPTTEASIDDHGFYSVHQQLQVSTIYDSKMVGPDTDYPDQYISPESFSQHGAEYVEDESTPIEPRQYFAGREVNPYFDEMSRSVTEDDSMYYENEYEVHPDGLISTNSPYAQNNEFVDEDDYGAEEKKTGIDKEDTDSHLENSVEFVKEGPNEPMQRYVDTGYGSGHDDERASEPFSPGETSTNTGYDSRNRQSPAMRGAHEILKKRRRRFEMIQSVQADNDNPADTDVKEDPDPGSPEGSADTWEESGSEITGSPVSGSSAWTDNSAPTDRTSRRALILQMARARMKNHKHESPAKVTPLSRANSEEDCNQTVATDGNTAEIDLTGDLD